MTMQELLQLQTKLVQKNNDSMRELTQSTTKLGDDFGSFTRNFEAANDNTVSHSKENTKRTVELNESLKSLKEVIKQNIGNFIKAGGGAKIGKEVIAAQEKEAPAGKLRKLLFGQQTAKETEAENAFGFSSSLSKSLTEKEKARDLKVEKEKYVEASLKSNDNQIKGVRNQIGTKTPEQRAQGDAAARKFAENKFDEIKKKEAALAELERKIDSVQDQGFNVKKDTLKERDKAAADLAEFDPRRRAEFKPEKGNDKPLKHTEKSEDQAESDTAIGAFYADTIKHQSDMGSTLIASLDIQKQSLESLKKIAESGGSAANDSSSSMLSDVADMAGNRRGRAGRAAGKTGMLSKAGSFLGRHALKIGAVGAVGMGAYEAYSGYNDAEDAVQRGEITKEEGQVKKSEAVGSGVGGAGGALAGAAAGAAIGSVVPVVGTAIGGLVGGAIGYYGGSKAGKAIGGAGAKAAQGMTAGETPVVDAMGNVVGVESNSSKIENASKKNEEIKTKKAGAAGNTLVNAPTNNVINNSNSNTPSRSPIRNQESTVSKYIENRYA